LITTKQRAFLKGLANNQPAILHIGKSGLTDNAVKQAEDALTARELIKVRVLKNALEDTDYYAKLLAESVGAETVSKIGNVFVLYRRNPNNPKINI
jgi:RNA-binding protein